MKMLALNSENVTFQSIVLLKAFYEFGEFWEFGKSSNT